MQTVFNDLAYASRFTKYCASEMY